MCELLTLLIQSINQTPHPASNRENSWKFEYFSFRLQLSYFLEDLNFNYRGGEDREREWNAQEIMRKNQQQYKWWKGRSIPKVSVCSTHKEMQKVSIFCLCSLLSNSRINFNIADASGDTRLTELIRKQQKWIKNHIVESEFIEYSELSMRWRTQNCDSSSERGQRSDRYANTLYIEGICNDNRARASQTRNEMDGDRARGEERMKYESDENDGRIKSINIFFFFFHNKRSAQILHVEQAASCAKRAHNWALAFLSLTDSDSSVQAQKWKQIKNETVLCSVVFFSSFSSLHCTHCIMYARGAVESVFNVCKRIDFSLFMLLRRTHKYIYIQSGELKRISKTRVRALCVHCSSSSEQWERCRFSSFFVNKKKGK